MKQKQWVQIAAVFFALMIVLTIFSRAAASVTKAGVTVIKAEKQTISHKIQISGTIEAKDNFIQYMPSGLIVKSVQVSPGQHVQSGDVLFTVDTQKLQEKIRDIEADIANVKKRESLSVSRAEKAYRDAVSDANEEKELAYRNRAELEVVTAQDGYEVAREQDKLVRAAADSLRQTKEDLGLEQGAKQLEDHLKELQSYLQNEGKYLAEYSGIVGRIFVEAGAETVEGIAALIADASGEIRLVATVSEECRDDIAQGSIITLKGKNLAGSEESYVTSDVAISEVIVSEPDGLAEYRLSSDIPGNLYPVGGSVSVMIDNQSEEYDICVPLQSLRQDGNNQYFVYVAEEQDTVFGKELTAEKMPVTVLDKNEKYAAVQEVISGDVIVSASKEITEGSRVKIIER